MDNFEVSGFLNGKYIAEKSEFSIYDGERLDKLKISATLNTQDDFRELIEFLQIHKHCFDKIANQLP